MSPMTSVTATDVVIHASLVCDVALQSTTVKQRRMAVMVLSNSSLFCWVNRCIVSLGSTDTIMRQHDILICHKDITSNIFDTDTIRYNTTYLSVRNKTRWIVYNVWSEDKDNVMQATGDFY